MRKGLTFLGVFVLASAVAWGAFTIPNTSSYARLTVSMASDWAAVVQAIGGQGVTSGCAVTTRTPPSSTLDVSACSTVIQGSVRSASAGTVTVAAPNQTYGRMDMVVLTTNSLFDVVQGAPAVTPYTAALPASDVLLATVYIPPLSNSLAPGNVVDKRVTLGSGGAPEDATFILQTPNSSLPNAQAISALASGILYGATGTGILTSLGAQLPLANGGTGAMLVDPGADKLLYWNDAGNTTAFLSIGSGLTILAGTLSASSSVCGANTYVQFNDASACGADSGLVYNKTTDTLTVGSHIGLGASDQRVGLWLDNTLTAATTDSFLNGIEITSSFTTRSTGTTNGVRGLSVDYTVNTAGGATARTLASTYGLDIGYVPNVNGTDVITSVYGININDSSDSGTGAPRNSFGLYIAAHDGASLTNYALLSEGPNYLYGVLSFNSGVSVAAGTGGSDSYWNIADLDNSVYRTFIQATAANTPTMQIAAPTGGALYGTYTTLTVTSTVAFSGVTAGAATGKSVVCMDGSGVLYKSSTGTDCSN